MESKLLEGDKDEWFYHSLGRYRNLYMFELEFPVDAIEVINEVNFCISGIQNYSKKCEILQLSIPPKLLPKDVEEGLCKDRDFTIISGGYTSARILQIKPIPAVDNLVATTQIGVNGVTLFQLGDDEHALVKEKSTLDLPESLGAGVIDGYENRLVATGTIGDTLYEWTTGPSGNFCLLPHKLPKNNGRITKVKYWDSPTVSFCTESGTVALYDTRSDKFILELKATKAAELLPGIQYSYDTVAAKHMIGIVDSCGGYESFDIRNNMTSSLLCPRVNLPWCSSSDGILTQKFNIQYDPQACSGGPSNFIVTGMKEDSVHIYSDTGTEVLPLFTHDGHVKVVTHALWHPTSDRLILSCSLDAVLHAWQYQVPDPCHDPAGTVTDDDLPKTENSNSKEANDRSTAATE